MLKSFPCIRQYDDSDSGAAALATVAAFYGIRASVAHLRDLSRTDPQGARLADLIAAAEKIGFRATLRSEARDGLDHNVALPAICRLSTAGSPERYVVLHQVRSKTVVVADPAVGISKWGKEDFLKRWLREDEAGLAFGQWILLVPTPLLKATETRTSATLKLWGLCHAKSSLIAQVLIASVIGTLLAIASSFFVQLLIDYVFPQANTSLLLALSLAMTALILFGAIFGYIRQYLLLCLAQRIETELELSYFHHILTLPLSFFRSHHLGDLYWRFYDGGKVSRLVEDIALGFLLDVALFALSSIVMLVYDWQLTMVIIGFFLAIVIITIVSGHRLRGALSRSIEANSELTGAVWEGLSGIADLKSFAAERFIRNRVDDRFVSRLHAEFKRRLASTTTEQLCSLFCSLGVLSILFYGSTQVLDGALSVGQLIFFSYAIGLMLIPVQRFAGALPQAFEALSALDRTCEILDLAGEEASNKSGYCPATMRGGIRFENVRFYYRSDADVLSGLNLDVPAGSTLGIVGESGGGKTTVAALINRLEDPVEGRILIDGIDVRDWDLKALRSGIALVGQEPQLFTGTVYENIALGAPGATLNDVMRAAKAANAHAFIQRLPARYQSQLGERGITLSTGEKQRISIARALVCNPRILILDEATSHLDADTEHAVHCALHEIKRGHTVIAISHRLSTIMRADNIIVMDHGRIIEQGCHEALVRAGGKYYSMWRKQALGAHEGYQDCARIDGNEYMSAVNTLRSVPPDNDHDCDEGNT